MSAPPIKRLPDALRRAQLLWRSPRLWRRRLAFLLGAVAVGLAAAAFASAADWSLHLFFLVRGQSVWLSGALTIAGFAICAAITRWLAPGARGSGIPQAIAARKRKLTSDRTDLLGARVTVVKLILTLVGLAIGAAVGREGPTVQLGASIMFLIAQFARLPRQSGVVLAGAAAGVAGAFNTPLAGIVFAIEELAKSYDRRVNLLVIAAVAIAGITSIWVAGNYRYFGTINQTFVLDWIWSSVPVCAVVGGIFGGLFSAAVVNVAFGRWRFARHIKTRPILFAAACGLGVALLGIASGGFANGTSYQATRLALEHGTAFPWWYGFCKLGATFFSSISGIPGGLFSPSLSVGAALGSTVSWLMPGIPASVIFLLMMAAYFSAVVQAPLTAFVIVTEMTADTSMAVPLILVTLIAASISRMICPVPLYHALSHTFDPRPETKHEA
jgi:H+/Cl- antiporter ClcA